MTTKKAESGYTVNGRVVLRRIGSDVLLVPVSGPAATGGGRVYPINATAKIIWNGLMNGDSLSDIVGALASRYDEPRETIETDVTDCVQTFLSEGLLKMLEL